MFATRLGVSKGARDYLFAVVNGASIVGRVGPAFLADKYGPMRIMAMASFASGVVICSLGAVSSEAGLIVYAAVFGAVR